MHNDIAEELLRLHDLEGADFSRQVARIAQRKEFLPVENEKNVYAVRGFQNDDYANLITAARKAVSFGYNVFILPNPKGIRTPDFIFERKGIYRVYDLKTIVGKGSVDSRLAESIGQTNRVLLNIASDYNAGKLARSIIRYFESYIGALEVIVFKGHKKIVITDKQLSTRTLSYPFQKSITNKEPLFMAL